MQNKYADRTAYAQIEAATEENVLMQLAHLKTHPSVAMAIAMESISWHKWLFHAETGEVATCFAKLGRYVPVAKVVGDANGAAAEFVAT